MTVIHPLRLYLGPTSTITKYICNNHNKREELEFGETRESNELPNKKYISEKKGKCPLKRALSSTQ